MQTAALIFGKQDLIVVERKKYNSITLQDRDVDAAAWDALSACTIENLNVSRCHVTSWAKFQKCKMTTLWLEDVTGLRTFSQCVIMKAFRTLILTSCNMEMATCIFPFVCKFQVMNVKIRDVDAMYLTHLTLTNDMSVRSIALSRTMHAKENYAQEMFEKVSCHALDEFVWHESGLGDKLIDALEKTRAAPWNLRLLDLRNNNLSLDVFERIEEFKQAVGNIANIDVSENNIPLHLSTSINSETVQEEDEEEDESSSEESMDVEEDHEEEDLETVAEEDDGSTSVRTLTGKRERKERVPRAKSMTLEALVARYYGTKFTTKKPVIKKKRI